MIVLDASAAIEWLLQTPKAPAIDARLFSKTADVSPTINPVPTQPSLRCIPQRFWERASLCDSVTP